MYVLFSVRQSGKYIPKYTNEHSSKSLGRSQLSGGRRPSEEEAVDLGCTLAWGISKDFTYGGVSKNEILK